MSSSFGQIFIVLLVLVGLVFLSAATWLNPVLDGARLAVEFLQYPFVKIFDGLKNIFDVLSQIRRLAVENRLLTQQVARLTADLAVSEKAHEENKILRQALGFQTETKLNVVPAEIIAWDFLNADRPATLNRGKKQGVTEGAAIVAPGSVLVGVVSKVFDQTSQMKILTASGVAVNAEVVPENATGVVRGEHGLGMTFDLVSQNVVIRQGEQVLTSGLGGQFPKNLLIGEIGKISSGNSELFQKASIAPAINLQSLRVVLIVKP